MTNKRIMKKTILFLILSLLTTTLFSQELWTSAGIKFGIIKKLSGEAEGECRTQNQLSSIEIERWTASVKLNYKLLHWLKTSAEYKYIHRHVEKQITKKGNIVSDYWQPRHRVLFSLTGSYLWRRFTLSLSERYQYTYHTELSVAKWEPFTNFTKPDELIKAKNTHTLRSNVKVVYDIKRSHFEPFISYELYNSLTNRFVIEKMRWTIGSDYKINKKHSLKAFYRYSNTSDEDEVNNHIVSIGYKFKL